MSSGTFYGLSVFLLTFPAVSLGATFEVIYNDGPNEGFNDLGAPHAQSQTDGNPGETLGEQRRWVFEKAFEYWGRRLESGITIMVDAEMNDLICDNTSAVLGSAGANSSYRDWTPAAGGSTPAFSNTWYSQSLANRIANKDHNNSINDIATIFNKHIDESNSCLGSNVWYYALGNAPGGTVSFYKTVLHEIGHGINVSTLVDLTDGTKAQGRDDIYMQFLEDHSLGSNWPNLTDQQRIDSAIDTSDLHWIGSAVVAGSGSVNSGKTGTHVHMYAPDPLEQGSSVSHWDITVSDSNGDNELMEPSATGTEKLVVTDEMLADMGWNSFDANNCTFANDRVTESSTLTGNHTHNACVSVTYDGASVNSGETNALAGQQIIMKNGFRVQRNATFTAHTDPSIGL